MEKVRTILSSLGGEGFSVSLDGGRILLDKVPRWVKDGKVLIRLVTPGGRTLFSGRCRFPCQATPVSLPDGTNFLKIWGLSEDGCFHPLHAGDGLPVDIRNGNACFVIPRTFEGNKDLFLYMTGEFNRKYDSAVVPCTAGFPEEVSSLAATLVKNCYTQYEKVLAVHDWVAGHIYYDEDAVADGSYEDECYDPLSVLLDRKAVCQGYSSLSMALLCCAGVRTVVMSCFALGQGISGGWENLDNVDGEANHAINMAYADDRWVIFDATWDSRLRYRDGRFQPCTGPGLTRLMFDPTLAFLSFSHRLIGPESWI